MNTLGIILIAIISITGFYVQLSDSWNTIYKANILFHPVFGAFATLWLLSYYAKHARERAGSGPLGKGGMTTVLVAGVAILSVLCAFSPKPFLAVAVAGCCLAFFFTTRRMLAANPAPHLKLSAASWQAVYFLLIITLVTGTALLPMQGLARNKQLFLFHRYVSYLTAGLFVISLFIPVITRRFAKIPKAPVLYLKSVRPMLLVVLIAAGALLLIVSIDKKPKGPVYKTSLSTIPIEKRAPEDQFEDPMSPKVADMMQSSESCATNPGCHQQEYDDFVISNHNISARTPYFQKNLDMLKDEVGEKNLLICAGCHYPYMMFSGKLDYKYYKTHNGFSCAFCHQIGNVWSHPDPKKKNITYMSVEPNVSHLEMFYNEDGNPLISKLDELLVKMNPTGHGRVFTKPLYYEDKYCQVCHALQIQTPKFTGLQQNKCIRCHMQPRYYLGFEGKKMNHYFPGTNTAVPYTLGYNKVVDMVAAWVRGDLSADVPSMKFWKLRKSGDERSDRAFWLFMNVEPINNPAAGGKFDFDVITTNVGIDHQFPSAPLDLVEAWLQVTVKDSKGNVLYQLGALDKNYRLPADYPSYHKLGGYMLDSKNHLLVQNRVWDIKKKVPLRRIMPYETVKDRIEVDVPPGTVGPLNISAQWNYRKLNQDFIDWGLAETDLGNMPKTAPATVVGSTDASIALK